MNNVLAFLPQGVISMTREQEELSEETKSRSVVLPVRLWDRVEKDAERCHRSVTKHLEAILSLYYGFTTSVNIDEEALIEASRAVPHKQLRKTG